MHNRGLLLNVSALSITPKKYPQIEGTNQPTNQLEPVITFGVDWLLLLVNHFWFATTTTTTIFLHHPAAVKLIY